MFVSLRRTQTWYLHTKLYKFGWNTSANSARMKNSRDRILCEVVYIWIIYRIPDSWLFSLTGYEFSFWHDYDMIFHVMVPVYRLVKIWNSPQFPVQFQKLWLIGRMKFREYLVVKALVNEDTLLRTHCRPWCFLGCTNWEAFVADTKCFWTKSETFFVSASNCAGKRGNICVGNNVSATMCPRLPEP